eukprot:g3663.t1
MDYVAKHEVFFSSIYFVQGVQRVGLVYLKNLVSDLPGDTYENLKLLNNLLPGIGSGVWLLRPLFCLLAESGLGVFGAEGSGGGRSPRGSSSSGARYDGFVVALCCVITLGWFCLASPAVLAITTESVVGNGSAGAAGDVDVVVSASTSSRTKNAAQTHQLGAARQLQQEAEEQQIWLFFACVGLSSIPFTCLDGVVDGMCARLTTAARKITVDLHGKNIKVKKTHQDSSRFSYLCEVGRVLGAILATFVLAYCGEWLKASSAFSGVGTVWAMLAGLVAVVAATASTILAGWLAAAITSVVLLCPDMDFFLFRKRVLLHDSAQQSLAQNLGTQCRRALLFWVAFSSLPWYAYWFLDAQLALGEKIFSECARCFTFMLCNLLMQHAVGGGAVVATRFAFLQGTGAVAMFASRRLDFLLLDYVGIVTFQEDAFLWLLLLYTGLRILAALVILFLLLPRLKLGIDRL